MATVRELAVYSHAKAFAYEEIYTGCPFHIRPFPSRLPNNRIDGVF